MKKFKPRPTHSFYQQPVRSTSAYRYTLNSDLGSDDKRKPQLTLHSDSKGTLLRLANILSKHSSVDIIDSTSPNDSPLIYCNY